MIRELGIDAQKLNEMSLDKRMLVLSDAFSNVTNESDRLRLAFKLFDSEGAALVNTLSQGREGLAGMLGEAEALGLVMSSDAAKGVEDAVDSLTRLKGLFSGVTRQLVAGLAPAIESLATAFTNKLKSAIDGAGGSVEQFGRNLAVDFLEGAKTAIRASAAIGNAVIGMYNVMQNARAEYQRLVGKTTFDSLQKDLDIINTLLTAGSANLGRFRVMGDDGLFVWYDNAELQQKKAEIIAQMNDLREQGKGSSLIEPIDVGALLKSLTESQNAVKNFTSATKSSLDEVAQHVTTMGRQPWWGKLMQPLFNGMELFASAADRVRPALFDLNRDMDAFVVGSVNAVTQGFTDAITGAKDFAESMKNMAKSVVDSLIKMLVQYYLTMPLFNAITGYFGGGFGGGGGGNGGMAMLGGGQGFRGAAAIGGSVQRGDPYLVGERGAEIFVPNQTGSIIPNNKLSDGGGVTVVQHINVTTGVQQTVRAEIATLMPQIANAAKNAVADSRMRGGSYGKALGA